jgi:penicillin-binding protein 1C
MALAAAASIPAAGFLLLQTLVLLTEGPSLARFEALSPLVLAADGQVLREYLATDDKWRLRTGAGDVPPQFLRLLIRHEDRRFYSHSGVDWCAVARATFQLLRHRRVASGASTLTMQAARLLAPGSRGLAAKAWQLVSALQLERRLPKAKILEIYLTLAPFGANIEGVRSASLHYFGKEPRDLQLQESALLIAMLQAPERRRPDRHPLAAIEARDLVLKLAFASDGGANPPELKGSRVELAGGRPFSAPHLADRLRRHAPNAATLSTNIELILQQRIEQVVGEGALEWSPDMTAAALVIRNADAAAVGYVGSIGFFDSTRSGQVDNVRAVRSPGSTLKPMIYGLGFEALIIHPSTIIADRPVLLEDYAPQNFDEGYQGDLTVREALIKSINTTAVVVLSRLTPLVLVTRLRNADIPLRVDDVDVSAGLSIGLGGAGITLEDLTRLYAGIANRGVVRPLRLRRTDAILGGKRLLTSAAAWALADILADVPPPAGFARRHAMDGGRRIAYKTGTSHAFRDAWAVGFDGLHTVGVWLGRANGAPTANAMGASAAAPVLFRIFDLLPVPEHDVAHDRPANSILTQSTQIPDRLRAFATQGTGGERHALRILFPRKDALVSTQDAGFVPLVADGGSPPYFWFVDGRPLADDAQRVRWQPDRPGVVNAVVFDSSGNEASVQFWTK